MIGALVLSTPLIAFCYFAAEMLADPYDPGFPLTRKVLKWTFNR